MKLKGLQLFTPDIRQDGRGYFFEAFRQADFDVPFVQDNHSFSHKGTLRGMHFQEGQAKLVRVAAGTIFDVAVDIRKNSETFGQWEGFVLDDEKHQALLIPAGFAHGFCVLSNSAHVLYKVSCPYDPAKESGFAWDDPQVGIDWPMKNPILSERDSSAPRLEELSL